jgi:hypothetical protein
MADILTPALPEIQNLPRERPRDDFMDHSAPDVRVPGHNEKALARRIIFINRSFFPDHSATSQILSDLAFHLVGRGADVQVVTSQQRYDPHAGLPEAESIGGVRIHRLSTTGLVRLP